MRDIFGNPFRPPPTLDPTWLTGTVKHLADAAYTDCSLPDGTLDAGGLSVLADALEQAGCQDDAILGHLREQQLIHVRGCWCVDLLRKKE